MAKPATLIDRRALYRQAVRTIRTRYGEQGLVLANVAEDLGCSTRQLQRVFREIGGEDFRAVLLRVRMERARVLLSRDRNPLPIVVVAPLVGYSKPSGLRQAFRRFYGINPSEVQAEPPEELWAEVREPEQ